MADSADLWLLPRFHEKHPNIRFCIKGSGDAPIRLGRADRVIRRTREWLVAEGRKRAKPRTGWLA